MPARRMTSQPKSVCYRLYDLDGVATVDEIDDGKALLPDTTTYQVIRGGNRSIRAVR